MTPSYIQVLKEILRVDFMIARRNIVDKIIDLTIWILTVTFVSVYLMPAFGVSQSFGLFMVGGLVASAGLFEVFPEVMNLVSDFEGDKIITLYTLLPMPTSFVFIRFLLYYAANSLFLTACTLPLCKLIFWNQIPLQNLNLGALLVMMVLTSLLYGALILWTTSMVPSVQRVGSVWMRFIYPLWFLGGFQFSWQILDTAFPGWSYLAFINPLLYVMEGMRVSLMGQEGYIPLWLCVIMLVFFIIAFLAHAIVRLKKRLDFV